MIDTFNYIIYRLKAPQAASDLLNELDISIMRLQEFPFSCREYQPSSHINRNYRVLSVKNYVVFYIVNEKEKTVEVQRVLYAKSDIDRIL